MKLSHLKEKEKVKLDTGADTGTDTVLAEHGLHLVLAIRLSIPS